MITMYENKDDMNIAWQNCHIFGSHMTRPILSFYNGMDSENGNIEFGHLNL